MNASFQCQHHPGITAHLTGKLIAADQSSMHSWMLLHRVDTWAVQIRQRDSEIAILVGLVKQARAAGFIPGNSPAPQASGAGLVPRGASASGAERDLKHSEPATMAAQEPSKDIRRSISMPSQDSKSSSASSINRPPQTQPPGLPSSLAGIPGTKLPLEIKKAGMTEGNFALTCRLSSCTHAQAPCKDDVWGSQTMK